MGTDLLTPKYYWLQEGELQLDHLRCRRARSDARERENTACTATLGMYGTQSGVD